MHPRLKQCGFEIGFVKPQKESVSQLNSFHLWALDSLCVE